MGHVVCIGYIEKMYIFLVGITEKKQPFGRSVNGRNVYIEVELTEIVWEDVKWIHQAKDRNQWQAIVQTIIQFRVRKRPKGFRGFMPMSSK
jgi:hypothetical protein